MAGPDNKRLLSALEANWQAEMAGFHTYSALSRGEADPHRQNALRGLATAEKHHAELWANRIKAVGGSEPQYTGKPGAKPAPWQIASEAQISLFGGWKSRKVGTSRSTVGN